MSKLKKTIIIVSCIILVVGLAIGGYFLYVNIRENNEYETALTLVDDLNVEAGKYIRLKDLIANLNGTEEDNFIINTSKTGENTISFKYKCPHGMEHEKTFTINVKDTTAPKILSDDYYTITKGSTADLTKKIFAVDNICGKLQTKILGTYDVNKVGNYNVIFSAKDDNGNETLKNVTFKVVEPNPNETKKSTTTKKIEYTDIVKEHKNRNTMIGIDISGYQKDIDWDLLKKSGVEFVFVKIGYQEGFGGDLGYDSRFERNMREANRVGIPVGGYFFSYAKTVDEIKEQTKFVSEGLSKFKVDLPIYFDWEDWSDFNRQELSLYDMNLMAHTFQDEMKNYGYESSIYGSAYYLRTIWTAEEFDKIWMAQYNDKVTYKGKYYIWQRCDYGHIEGIDGNLDVDIMYLN